LELIVILSATFLFLVAYFFWLYITARNERRQRKRAIKASAKIIKIGHSRNTRDGDVIVYLTLEVTPPNGTPYMIDTDWFLGAAAIPKVEVGRIVAVKIDAKDPKKIYSAERWFTDSNH
jgi:hypothetical protein